MFSWDDFMSLPQVEDVSDFHCVTTWSRLNNHWGAGVRLMDIENYCEVVSTAKFVYIKAYDVYSTNLPLNRSHESGCFASSSMGRSSINN
jgi:DMSO/TMAO reductase YedYZ molybdopterin-dependent catalytic subunit